MLSASQSPSAGPAVFAGYEIEGSSLCEQRDSIVARSTYGSDEPPPSLSAQQQQQQQQQGASAERENRWIWVLDPMTRKLRVPLHLLAPTQATATSGTVPSLCIAYLEGRCRHPWCRQAHVLPSAITQLRMEALNAPTCCHFHKAPHDLSRLTSRFRYLRITNNGPSGNNELITTDRVASTVGLLRYLVQNVPPPSHLGGGAGGNDQQDKENNSRAASVCGGDAAAVAVGSGSDAIAPDEVLELPAKFICRLHLAHRCRYLEDCNNIHICREYESRLQPPPHVLNMLCTIGATTRTVTLGDVCYTVTPLALGDVSDDDFAAITDTQRKRVQQSGTTTVTSTPQWTVTTNTTTAAHATELLCPAAISLPTTAAFAHTGSSLLDGWAGASTTTATDTPSFTLPPPPPPPPLPPPSYSPVVSGMLHGGGCGVAAAVGHLRVYDVCSSRLNHGHASSAVARGAVAAAATMHSGGEGSAVTRTASGGKREQCTSSSTECGASVTSVPDNNLAADERKEAICVVRTS